MMKTIIICLLGLVLMSSVQGASLPEVTVKAVRVQEAPRIDGDLEEKAWKEAEWKTGFFVLNHPETLAGEQTRFAVLYDEDNLYLGIEAFESQVNKIIAKASGRDGFIHRDDCLELFFNPHVYQLEEYFYFAFNSLGARYDGKCGQEGATLDKSWNPDWKVAAKTGFSSWQAEISIPFYLFEIDGKVNQIWGFNITRERRAGDLELSTFAPLIGGFQQSGGFGKLVGLDEGIISSYAYDLGEPVFASEAKGEKEEILNMTVPLQNLSGKTQNLYLEGYLISPSEKIFTAKTTFSIDDKVSKNLTLGDYTLDEEGQYRVILNLIQAKVKKTRALSQSSYEFDLTPIKVEMTKPLYRNAIYATFPLDSVELEINLRRKSLLGRGKLVISLGQEEGRALEEKTVRLSSPLSRVSLPTQDLETGKYSIEVKLIDENDRLIYSTREPLEKLPRGKSPEVIVDSLNGQRILVNGKPVFPFGWWSVNPKEMKDYAEKGYNLIGHHWTAYLPPDAGPSRYQVEGKYIKLHLDTAAKYGLKMPLYPYPDYQVYRRIGKTPLSTQDEKEIEKAVLAYKDHPGLLGWYIKDEPESAGAFPAWLEEVYKIVRRLDPYHPVFAINNSIEGQHAYRNCVDIFSPDVYPYPHIGKSDYDFSKTRIVGSLEAAKKAGRDKKPIWVVLQAWNPTDDEAVVKYQYLRGPTFEEVRLATYLAIIHGADGIFYYLYSRQWVETPDMRIGVLECILPEIKYLTPALLSPEELELEVSSGNGKVHALLKEYDGDLYLFAANTLNEPTQAQFEIPTLTRQTSFRVISEKRKIKSVGKVIKDKFKGYEVHIYTTSPDLPKLKKVETILQKIEKAKRALGKKGNLAFKGTGTSSMGSSMTTQGHSYFLVNDGMTSGKSYWEDATQNKFPDWVEVIFPRKETFNKIVVYTPNLKDYELQRWDGNNWITLDKIVGNTEKIVTHKFNPVTAEKIRLWTTAVNPEPPYAVEDVTLAPDVTDYVTQSTSGFSRIYEIEVYGSQ